MNLPHHLRDGTNVDEPGAKQSQGGTALRMDITPLLVVLLGASLLRVGRSSMPILLIGKYIACRFLVRCGTLGDSHPSFRVEGDARYKRT